MPNTHNDNILIPETRLERESTGRPHYPLLQVTLACLACCFLYLKFFAFQAHVELDMRVADPRLAELKLYWTEGEVPFEESRSSGAPVSSFASHYTLGIGSLGDIDRLRLDPIDYPGVVAIDRIAIIQPGYEPVVYQTGEDFRNFTHDKHALPPEFEDDALRLETTGRDGQLVIEIDPKKTALFAPVHLVNMAFIILLITFAYRFVSLGSHELAFVPWLLGCALVLATAMAAISTFNVHPDEIVHFKAVNWYNGHILPPAIDDPEIADSFSHFGKSRLSSYEVFYPVAGYFTRLLEPYHLSVVFQARLFGLTLLAILLIWSIRNPVFCCFTLPLLITPQVWYFFSYINSDVFGVFLSIIASYQAAYSGSILNRYLTDDSPTWFIATSVLLGALFGAMVLLKPNYYFFILFLGFYLLWRLFYGDFPDRTRLFKRLGIVAIIALTFPAIRYGLDIRANGPETFEKYQQMIEEKASYWYRPSTPLNEKHIYLYQRERGHSLDYVLRDELWGAKTLVTSFGSYGYTQYNPGETGYGLIKWGTMLLFLTMVISALVHGPPKSWSLILIASASTILLLFASLWASWDINFQPQGRYMAPALAICGLLFYHLRPYLVKPVFYPLVLGMFTMGLYSFVFVGLRLIAKTSSLYF